MLLALARLLVAPEPSPAPTDAAPPTTATTDVAETSEDTTAPLLLIDFRPRARTLNATPAAHDLRNPFRASAVQASAPPSSPTASSTAGPTRRQRASARRHDLRDPFAEPPRKRRGPAKPAEDLRDPFNQPAPALPKCPDTGGVPIQRPDTVRAGCAQASRSIVLAHR